MLRFLLEDGGLAVVEHAAIGTALPATGLDNAGLLVAIAGERAGGLLDDLLWLRRAGHAVPIILVARGDVRGLRQRARACGVHDVVAIPMAARDLQRRLLSALGTGPMSVPPNQGEQTTRAGGLTLHAGTRIVSDDSGWSVRVTRQEATLLRALMRAPGQVVPYSLLQSAIWGQAGARTSNALAVYVRRLRASLARPHATHGYIKTVHGRGYTFDARSGARPARVDESGGRPRVLVIDDDKTLTAFVTEVLEGAGYAVAAAMGSPALALARQERPDLILLDINMPDIDGVEVRRQLRATPRTAGIPVVALSAGGNLRLRASEMDANDYLPKPFTMEELLLRVEKWVGQARN